jgi:hypothetical protein
MEFTISSKCSRCNGSGTLLYRISTDEVIDIVKKFTCFDDETHLSLVGTTAKIPAIKELRSRYSELSLVKAKGLIEGALELYKSIDKNAEIRE